MAKKFQLVASKENMMWTVSDENGISIKFREGLFNETQDVNYPDGMTGEQIEQLPTALREIGEWMMENHEEVAVCHPAARCRAIWVLDNERYWYALADAMKSLIVDWDENQAATFLYSEVEDYLQLENGVGLNEAEQCNLLGSLSLLDDEEAMEVVNIVYVFWQHCEEKDTETWARELLWWPAWCPAELREPSCQDVDEDGEEGE